MIQPPAEIHIRKENLCEFSLILSNKFHWTVCSSIILFSAAFFVSSKLKNILCWLLFSCKFKSFLTTLCKKIIGFSIVKIVQTNFSLQNWLKTMKLIDMNVKWKKISNVWKKRKTSFEYLKMTEKFLNLISKSLSSVFVDVSINCYRLLSRSLLWQFSARTTSSCLALSSVPATFSSNQLAGFSTNAKFSAHLLTTSASVLILWMRLNLKWRIF